MNKKKIDKIINELVIENKRYEEEELGVKRDQDGARKWMEITLWHLLTLGYDIVENPRMRNISANTKKVCKNGKNM